MNYGGTQGQCYVRLPFADLGGRAVRLADLMGPDAYDRDGSDLLARGLYLDMPPRGYQTPCASSVYDSIDNVAGASNGLSPT